MPGVCRLGQGPDSGLAPSELVLAVTNLLTYRFVHFVTFTRVKETAIDTNG